MTMRRCARPSRISWSPWGCGSRPARSAQDFLRGPRPEGPSCLVLDVRLPGLSGLELQQRLTAGDLTLPIIFITGHGDIPMSVQASPCGCLTSDTWTSYPGLEEEVDGKHH